MTRRWCTALLCGLLLLSPPVLAQDAQPEAAAGALLGPIITAAGPDGFSINVGDPAGLTWPATLLVLPSRGGEVLQRLESTGEAWHRFDVHGLQSAHRYRYRVLRAGRPAAEGEVSTAPPDTSTAPLTVVVFGDERGLERGVAAQAATVSNAVLSEDPDVVLGTGDLLTAGGDLLGWRGVAEAHRALFAQVLYLPTLGNHEIINDPEARTFRRFFPQAQQRYYAARYGRLLVIVLDSNRINEAVQTRFLEAQLQASVGQPGLVRFVLMHHAPFSLGSHCGSWQEMRPWIDLFERYHVAAVFSGHDHSYQRAERAGVAYFVSGGGGAPLYERNPCPGPDEVAVQSYLAAYHYLLLRIDAAGHITTLARSPQGPPFDRASLPLPVAGRPPLPTRPPLYPRHSLARRIPNVVYGLGGAALALILTGVLYQRRRLAERHDQRAAEAGR